MRIYILNINYFITNYLKRVFWNLSFFFFYVLGRVQSRNIHVINQCDPLMWEMVQKCVWDLQ